MKSLDEIQRFRNPYTFLGVGDPLGKDSCQPRAFSSFVELQNIDCPADGKHSVRVLVAFAMELERPVKATVSYEISMQCMVTKD